MMLALLLNDNSKKYQKHIKNISASVTLTKQKGSIGGSISISIIMIICTITSMVVFSASFQ